MATTSGMWPVALGKSGRSGVGSGPKPIGGIPRCLETGTRARRECDRGGGSGTERGRGRCGSGAAVLGMARHAAGSLLQGDSSPTPHTLYTTMSSRQPAALTPRPLPTSAAARRRTSHGRDPSRPHPLTLNSSRCPPFLGNEECPHYGPYSFRSTSAKHGSPRSGSMRGSVRIHMTVSEWSLTVRSSAAHPAALSPSAAWMIATS